MTAKPYRIEWRPMAGEDLRTVVRYIGKSNSARAKRFGQELRETKQSRLQTIAWPPRRQGLPDWLRELVVHLNYALWLGCLS